MKCDSTCRVPGTLPGIQRQQGQQVVVTIAFNHTIFIVTTGHITPGQGQRGKESDIIPDGVTDKVWQIPYTFSISFSSERFPNCKHHHGTQVTRVW